MRVVRSILGVAAGALFAIASAVAADQQAVPPVARITDTTGTLSADQKQQLEATVTALEQRKGSQVAILFIATTEPEDIAQYSYRVVDTWKLGRKGVDDGVLITVAKDDRHARIEVGRGLEGAITDADSARIIREYMQPKFRNNDYFGGLQDALAAVIKLIDGETLPPPLEGHHASDDSKSSIGSLIFNALIFSFVLGRFFGGAPTLVRAGLTGVLVGGMGWLVSRLMVAALGMGAVGFFIGLVVGRGAFLGGGGGGWSSGGGGFSGGGGGGGGFSGGGGGFSGGGASGSW